MVKWTEVSAYSGMPVDEDAPTVHTGPAIAGTGDDSSVVVMKKKKKKTLIDARTKTYKEHQRRLQLARERREERKRKAKEKMNEQQVKINPASLKGTDSIKIKVGTGMSTTNQVKRFISRMKGKLKITQKGDDFVISGDKKNIANLLMSLNTRFMSGIINPDSPPYTVHKEEVQKTFTQKVQEQISGFERESFLAENNMNVIKSIVKSKGAKNIKMKDGSLKMDYFTASAISKVYDKVNPANKKRMEDLANGKKSDLMKLQSLAMKFVK